MDNLLRNAEFYKVKSIKIPLGPLAISNSPIIHHNAPSRAEWDRERERRRVNCRPLSEQRERERGRERERERERANTILPIVTELGEHNQEGELSSPSPNI